MRFMLLKPPYLLISGLSSLITLPFLLFIVTMMFFVTIANRKTLAVNIAAQIVIGESSIGLLVKPLAIYRPDNVISTSDSAKSPKSPLII